MVGESGVISTTATGVSTIIFAVARFTSATAVIVVEPERIAVTRPAEVMRATSGSLVVQVTGWAERSMPFESRMTGVSSRVSPTSSDAVNGSTTRLATTLGPVRSGRPSSQEREKTVQR
jgi:hypothetical protein